ncbi:hypothetical protein HJG54_33215 [Leptolyngbya sp. NK1-12]|uniref:Calcium-binding protein n=1 Tax=Leptolyngbya sp. NK1-12 TaxID=2547451 RepID=A0AA97ASU8_9CYAN|nr:calcium-binding protein [Leptolyngbya sp. NK1-12]WNZ27708.1 hypothetical protein HJG54_33215 [Leptolyngbya sp. NK1-12]
MTQLPYKSNSSFRRNSMDDVLANVVGSTFNDNGTFDNEGVFHPRLVGAAGDDTIIGFAGEDILEGLGGNDHLLGGSENDALDGGIGIDQMEGGAGNDTYFVDASTDIVIEAADLGFDIVFTNTSFTLSANVENLTLISGGVDGGGLPLAWRGTGNDLHNRIQGNERGNFLVGLAGDDRLIGGRGGDTLRGGIHTDRLFGEADNDLLEGEQGNDFLEGAAGLDTIKGASGGALGKGVSEQDSLLGGTGADEFVLADQNDVFYVGGKNGDYALIQDFTREDKIFLEGSASKYVLGGRPLGFNGTGIYRDLDNNGQLGRADDLVAIVRNSPTNFSLSQLNYL